MRRVLTWGLPVALAAVALGAFLWVEHWTRSYEEALRAVEFERARSALDRLAVLGRDTAEQHILLAHGYAAAGNLEASEQELLRAIEIEPLEQAWVGLGLLRFNLGKWEGVIEAHEGSRAAGGGTRLLRRAARSWMELGDPEAATAVMDTAAREHPDSREVHVLAANLATEQEDWKRVIHHFEQALRIEPDLHYAANNLAWYHATQEEVRDPERALELAHRALEGDQADNPSYLETLSRAQAAAGRTEAAIATAHRALDQLGESDDPALRERLRAWLAENEPASES